MSDETSRPGPINPGGPQFVISERRIALDGGAQEYINRLKSIGDSRMCPPGAKYIGSFAVHVYKGRFDPSVSLFIQRAPGSCTVTEANYAMQELAKNIARSYGWKDPATRQDVARKDTTKGLILLDSTPTTDTQPKDTSNGTDSPDTAPAPA